MSGKSFMESPPAYERVPTGFQRHAAPCGPWPWNDHDAEEDHNAFKKPNPCDHKDCKDCEKWLGYPQSHFGNWTPGQVQRSGIADAVKIRNGVSRIHRVNVRTDGTFMSLPRLEVDDDVRSFWNALKPEQEPNVRIRAFFIESLTGPVLQMLGARYNIEPFFFSSSLKWIPSRFQEDLQPNKQDHVTITLTFLRCLHRPEAVMKATGGISSLPQPDILQQKGYPPSVDNHATIDAQKPLFISTRKQVLLLDLMSIHLVREPTTSTFISYHPLHQERTTAKRLHARVKFAGDSVYWQHIWKDSSDPTFLLLATIWHALYAWDEALEALYEHFCSLEATLMREKNRLDLTQELYVIRAHLLHWSSLIDDLRKSVVFLDDHRNPAMNEKLNTKAEIEISNHQFQKEIGNMKMEIDRLEKARDMQDKRLKNAMDLVFATVNIQDSRQMQELTRATVRDSAAMKLISVLTMVYLPSSFAASVFGMNIDRIVPGTLGTISAYFATSLPLTTLTIYTVMVFQMKYSYDNPDDVTLLMRLLWPLYYLKSLFQKDERQAAVFP